MVTVREKVEMGKLKNCACRSSVLRQLIGSSAALASSLIGYANAADGRGVPLFLAPGAASVAAAAQAHHLVSDQAH